MTRRRPSRRTAAVVMWSSIGTSALLAVALLARGWGGKALTIAAGVLFVLCVATCIWAGVIGNRSERDVRRAFGRLAAQRRASLESSRRNANTEGGAR